MNKFMVGIIYCFMFGNYIISTYNLNYLLPENIIVIYYYYLAIFSFISFLFLLIKQNYLKNKQHYLLGN